jgi:hypothetical protein
MTQEEKHIYLAGLFDGAATVNITERISGLCTHHSVHIALNVSDKKICEWLSENFGGKVTELIHKRVNYATRYAWRMPVKTIDKLFDKLKHIVKSKVEQLEVIGEFRETFLDPSSFSSRDQLVRYRRDCMNRLRKLNRKKNYAFLKKTAVIINK